MAARLCALRAHITAPPPRLPTTRTRQTSHETPTLQLPPNYETPDHTNKSRTSADWRLAQPDAGFDDQLSAPHVCDQCGRMKARTGAADRSRRCRPQASDLRRSFQVKRRPRYRRIRPARIFLLAAPIAPEAALAGCHVTQNLPPSEKGARSHDNVA